MSAAPATPEGKSPSPLRIEAIQLQASACRRTKTINSTAASSLTFWTWLIDSTVLWAQRSNKTEAEKNFIYLTISVPDVQPSKLKLDLKPQSLSFAGHSESLKRYYQLQLDFYDEIDVSASKIHHTAKNIEMVLRKKELKEEFWPRLLKDAKKVHFLKTDFDKWVDEDEQDEAPEDDLGMF
jgi:hypothetical protein